MDLRKEVAELIKRHEDEDDIAIRAAMQATRRRTLRLIRDALDESDKRQSLAEGDAFYAHDLFAILRDIEE